MLHATATESKSKDTRAKAPPDPDGRYRQHGGTHTSLNRVSGLHSQQTHSNQALLRRLGESRQTGGECAACGKAGSKCSACAEEEHRPLRMLKPVDNPSPIRRQIKADDGGAMPAAGPAPASAAGTEPAPASSAGAAGSAPATTAGDAGSAQPVPMDDKKDAGTTCPAETITMSGAQCSGTKYGAVAKYCLAGVSGWWFKESVVDGTGTQCQSGGGISQTTTPFQNTGGCIKDDIFDTNGPPSKVAPCNHLTKQVVFAGPTQATVEQCKYNHDQIINVSKTGATGGQVTTSAGGVSTQCAWTP
jgi:hypothetical protein